MDNFKLTDKGRILLSKVVDAPLTLTNMSLGRGVLNVFNPNITTLVDEVMTQEIERCYRENDGIYAQTIFTNETLEMGFYVNEIGIFALDPDEGEILYAYANTYGEQTDFFKPGVQNVILKEIIEAKIVFGNASEVLIIADPSKVYATIEMLNNVRIIADQAYDLANSEKTASEIKFVNTISTADIDNVQDAITTMVTETKAGLEFLKTKADNAQNKADQAFQSASNGKQAIKTAITGKDPSVTIPTDATFAQLAAAIGQIETGVNTDDATATAEHLLAGLTMYVKGLKIIGTMANRGAVNQSLGVNGSYIIPQGYHNGQGKVSQSIPVAYPDYSDQKATADVSVGAYTGDGQNYAYIHVPNNHFISGVNWMRSHQPDLIGPNILQGKNIFGIAGSAVQGKRWASGSVGISADTDLFTGADGGSYRVRYITVTGLTFLPSFIFVVCTSSNYANAYTTIYDSRGFTTRTGLHKISTTSLSDQIGTTTITNGVRVAGPAYVNEGSFQLPVPSTDSTWSWIALE